MNLPENIPREVKYSEVEDFDEFDTRRSAIDGLYINIIGVNEDGIEWCPNDDPPSKEEYLAWLWVIKPSMGTEILNDCSEEMTKN